MSLLYGYQSRKQRYSTDPARLDRRVSLQYAYVTRDELGGEQKLWFEAAQVWASKQFTSGRRMYAAEAKHGEDFFMYRIRHRLDVARFWRLAHGDDVYEIVAVEELGRRHLLDLTCRAIDQTVGDVFSGFLLEDGGYLTTEDDNIIIQEAA